MADPKGTDKSVPVVEGAGRRSTGRVTATSQPRVNATSQPRVTATSQPIAKGSPARSLGRRAKVSILVGLAVVGIALVLVVATDDERGDVDGVADNRTSGAGGAGDPSTSDPAAGKAAPALSPATTGSA